jgi:hypothetical protein
MRKKVLAITICIVIGSNYLLAQPFKAGTISIQGGVEFGGNYGIKYYNTQTLAKAASIEIGLPKIVDDGYFGIGLYYGAKTFNEFKQYPLPGYFAQYNWDYTIFGARFTYHIDLISVKSLDTYCGFMINYNEVKFNYSDNFYSQFPNMKGNPYPLTFANNVKYTAFIGVCYDIRNIAGVFAEFALGNYAAFIGINIKLFNWNH